MTFPHTADDTHAATWTTESAASAPTSWETWAVALEQRLGHDLDGDQDTDGYSLDFSFEMFTAGLSPSQAAAAINANVSLLHP